MTLTQKRTCPSYRAGFTLLELSIVLVIIGLIIGAILVGKDLIKAAELRAFVSQIEKYNTAFATFKLKYDCVAGDCANTTDYFPSLINGDGNGLIDSSSSYPGGYNFIGELSNA